MKNPYQQMALLQTDEIKVKPLKDKQKERMKLETNAPR